MSKVEIFSNNSDLRNDVRYIIPCQHLDDRVHQDLLSVFVRDIEGIIIEYLSAIDMRAFVYNDNILCNTVYLYSNLHNQYIDKCITKLRVTYGQLVGITCGWFNESSESYYKFSGYYANLRDILWAISGCCQSDIERYV